VIEVSGQATETAVKSSFYVNDIVRSSPTSAAANQLIARLENEPAGHYRPSAQSKV
jgi:hypothetical protein